MVNETMSTAEKLARALEPFAGAELTDGGRIVGLMREDFDRARSSLAAYRTRPAPETAGEVAAWGQLGMLNGHSYLREVYDRFPYPPPADVVRNLNLVPLYTAPAPAQRMSEEKERAAWPKSRDVARLEDMSPDGHLRITLDSDSDVLVEVFDGKEFAHVEFCTPGSGGGKSSNTRAALIALAVAIEKDNAEQPSRAHPRFSGAKAEGER